MIRKIEVDENGNIFHVYKIKADVDPHNPDGGLEVSENHAALHEDMINNLGQYHKAYIYDKAKGLRKRKLEEREDNFKGELKNFKEIPNGFIKRDLEKIKGGL